jgi:polysaccharide export outer membrane protein
MSQILTKEHCAGLLPKWITRTMFSIALLQLPALASASDASGYKIAAGDVLTITVYGDTGLSGIFPVSVDGTISYPILGNLAVTDKSVIEIGDEIAKDLMTHIANLSVAVAVKEYAPVFIIGDVQKPGKYEFRPGMITLELFALGGGLREATTQTDMSGIQLIAAQQEYEDMSVQLLSQDVRRVRLEAELNDKPFEYSANNDGSARDPVTVQNIIDGERNLYKLRLSVMENQKKNLEDQRQNFIEEIDTLEKSGSLRNEQFALLKLDVDASQGLVTRGAASESTLRERKRELLAMNQQLLEFGSFLARAKQNKNEMERQIQELQSKRQNDAVAELRDISLDTIRLRKKMAYSIQTMAEIGAAARRVTALEKMIKTEFSVVRQKDGEYTEVVIDEHTPIKAGDVIRVQLVPTIETSANVRNVN